MVQRGNKKQANEHKRYRSRESKRKRGKDVRTGRRDGMKNRKGRKSGKKEYRKEAKGANEHSKSRRGKRQEARAPSASFIHFFYQALPSPFIMLYFEAFWAFMEIQLLWNGIYDSSIQASYQHRMRTRLQHERNEHISPLDVRSHASTRYLFTRYCFSHKNEDSSKSWGFPGTRSGGNESYGSPRSCLNPPGPPETSRNPKFSGPKKIDKPTTK